MYALSNLLINKNVWRVGTNIKVLDKAVQLPKLGLVKCHISKEVKGRILSATVSQNPSGKYFVSLCCTDVEMETLPTTGAMIGIDMGLKAFAITSDGMEYPNHKHRARKNLPSSSGSCPENQRGVTAGRKRESRWPGLSPTLPGASSGGSWSIRRGGMGNSWSRWTASFHPVSYAPLAALNGPAQRICPCESGFAPSAALSMTGM